jgi:ubiquinol-cytochrome c reductase iron-sulfur subunit
MSTHVPPKGVDADVDVEELSTEELSRLGMKLDGVDIVHRADRWPVRGTRAERRAERGLAAWFALAAVAGLAFLGVYIFWPWEYVSPNDPGKHTIYLLYTPLLGLTLGIAVFAVGVAVIAYSKKFLPDEVASQDRHDGPSAEVDRRTIAAELVETGQTSGIPRRRLIVRTAGVGIGVMSLGMIVLPLGGLIKNPWRDGNKSPLLTTGWAPSTPGEKVYLRKDTGDPTEVALVRPEDMDAGSMQTVFPFRDSERGNEEALIAGLRRSDSPVMLIRLRPGTQTIQRKGFENYNYGDYWAFSKVCTHLGCPTSLYEQQTNRILCPCHQSQFDATHYGKPIFGPATRALPQLPLAVDEQGYFYARGDFGEPVGPGFWERKS